MEPPTKRPRLSVFPEDSSHDADFSRARYRNDLSLKTRFEAIFEKYAHDFTGIGDEIEVATGEIVVNNGHLEAMQDEQDIGTPIPTGHITARKAALNGGSLLRAMTVAPENDFVSLDDVEDDVIIMSIENMAHNAARGLADEAESDSEDSLLGRDETSQSHLEIHNRDLEQSVYVKQEEAYDSNSEDSLLGGDEIRDRSSSPDSLFEGNAEWSVTRKSPQLGRWSYSGTSEDLSESAILEKFGPQVGPQVLQVLEQQRNMRVADIEPAWRVPEIGNVFSSAKPTAFPTEVRVERRSPSAWQGSIWEQPKLPKSILRRPISAELSSSESEDPLQEGFTAESDEMEEEVAQQDDNGDENYEDYEDKDEEEDSEERGEEVEGEEGCEEVEVEEGGEEEEEVEEEVEQDEVEEEGEEEESQVAKPAGTAAEVYYDEDFGAEDLEEGICPFCKKHLSGKGGVFCHWDNILRRPREDGIHDMVYIKERRGRAKRWSTRTEMSVADFRKLVKLHEVDKMDFQQIAELKMFGDRPRARLHDFYYRYRRLAKSEEELAAEGLSWTAAADERLLRYCEDPDLSFLKLKKLMNNRDKGDIGNRLATLWMQEYVDQGVALVDPKIKWNRGFKTVRQTSRRKVAASRRIDPESSSHSPYPTDLAAAGDPGVSRSRRSKSTTSVDSIFL